MLVSVWRCIPPLGYRVRARVRPEGIAGVGGGAGFRQSRLGRDEVRTADIVRLRCLGRAPVGTDSARLTAGGRSERVVFGRSGGAQIRDRVRNRV